MVPVVVLMLLAALANAGALVLLRKTALGEPAASSFSLRGCVLVWPGGQVIVVAAGLVAVGVGLAAV